MIAEIGTEGYQPMTSFIEENLFKLQCLIKATEIQHSAQCEYEKKLFLAFTTGNAEIFLYYKKDSICAPIIKRIPWFQGSHKQISALCFHSVGSWLLASSVDGSVYIIPALCLVDENCDIDQRWTSDDITSFPSISLQSSHSKPTAIVWWQDSATSAEVGIIGTEYGEIIFINLESGHQTIVAHVNGNIASLHICCNESNDSVSLLITSQSKQQWRLLLEQHTYSCLRHLENGESYNSLHTSDNIYDNTRTFASTRSRLQGLKQLSVEKLAILRQKLIETKSQTLDFTSNRNTHNATVNFDSSTEVNQNQITPEPISKETFLMSQSDREGQQLYTCYHSITNHITIHGPDFSAVPLSVHKVFESCRNVLLTQRFFFITDVSQRVIYIMSDRLSETRKNDNCKFNPECIIGHFSLVNSKEVIRAVYRAIDFTNNTSFSQDIKNKYTLPKGIKDIEIELPQVDTCIIVTNHSVYKVVLRKSVLSIFMELVLKDNEPEKAIKLAIVFGINAQLLLEQASDILLSNKQFSRAVACYKLSKCRVLKSVLKYASAGYTVNVLRCLTQFLASPAISKLPVTTRIHLSNLCVLAFIEMTLRVPPQKSRITYKEFLYFLSTNSFYDELLAINIAGQTCLWEVLHHLATQKCLYGQMLDVLMKTIHSFSTSNFHPTSYGLLICISEPSLIQAMLVNPELARSHMSFILDNLQDSQIFVLQRLVALYDPTNPVIRPRIVQCRLRHRATSHSSQSSQCDSIDLLENEDGDALVEEIIETFLLILLTLIYKKSILEQEPSIACNIELLGLKKGHNNTNSVADFKRRPLCAGFYHVVLIRNGNVYTWGSSVQGCLGTGPSLLWYGTAQPISFFWIMELEVLSVSCGHCHTLAVTNNGVYAWGSNQFGQLGLGKILQCSSPELITSLAQEIIVDAVAGQYHSVALTADGRVFTWGWGVHGQLGHGSTDKKNTPTLVTSLLGVFIRSISAGHAHTLALSTEGIVYAFGCNVFGQLGIGSNVKSSVPMKVLLSEKISLIATGYFHNLAVSHTNKLYVWGASPQVLRWQAQTQKRHRILEQRDAIVKQFENIDEFEKVTDHASTNDTCEEATETNIQNKNAQLKSLVSADMRRKQLDMCLKNVDIGSLEENQTHLKPSIVDTSLVKGNIIQISTGCHHNALVTKDGSLYTWGRNLDGQIGNGSKQEVSIPTPLCYNPASIMAQVPPRHNAYERAEEEQELDGGGKNSAMNDRNGNVNGESRSFQMENNESKEKLNSVIKTVSVCCGYDYTVAIQSGGTVFAWGNNRRAQLGRLPPKDARDTEDKLVLIKKRVARIPNMMHIALDVPSQVPNLPAPIISYLSYDMPPLAGLIRPLSLIEKSPGELTLHYALEYFCGLYDASKIMEKCIELENYQACSKIAMLQHNISDAFVYQLKILRALSLKSHSKVKSSENLCKKTDQRIGENSNSKRKSLSTRHVKKNTELFNKQVEKNLMDSVEDCAVKNKMKIPASRSLNSLQLLQEELYSFDCQGGSEELCKDMKCENTSLDIFEDTFDSDISSDSEEWMEKIIFKDNQLRKQEKAVESNGDYSVPSAITKEGVNQDLKETSYEKKVPHSRQDNVINEAIKVIKFFLHEMENETDTVKCKILQDAVDFWIEHNLPIQSIENVFLEHIQSIFYPLGLLLFCQDIMEKYLDMNKNDTEVKSLTVVNFFSVKFCIQVCSMLLHHIGQGQPTPEFIKLLSSLTADHYGPPLTGYPGTSGNNTSKQMIEGVMSTVSFETPDSRSFVHIKDPDAVYRFLATEEDTMVFTCGHHFPLSVYEREVIPTMETDLLTSESLILPYTAQYLEKMLSETSKPEILCPSCIPRALGLLAKKNNG
ncbi:RCC1 and BTB domain containing protein claret isoform X2 [Ptiloglossa arizonensis]|uniref:RCC1 and BTB domain containing protein claret isoform X2 n=1 Tax=Ptiloglossa arizonensis TaxID=3350558 RepID=UPI003FA02A69